MYTCIHDPTCPIYLKLLCVYSASHNGYACSVLYSSCHDFDEGVVYINCCWRSWMLIPLTHPFNLSPSWQIWFFVHVHNMNDIDAHTGYLVYCTFVWRVYPPIMYIVHVCTADIWDVLQWWWAPYRTDDWSASGVKVSLGEWICTLPIYCSCHTLQWHVHVCASKCYNVCVHRFCTPWVVCKWYGHVQHVTGGHCVKTPVQA